MRTRKEEQEEKAKEEREVKDDWSFYMGFLETSATRI